jgi:BirA family biotin operon repressor/biotin-[acetyl-CoA-carboxylase] ligase
MEDRLSPDRVEPLFGGAFGRPYVYRSVCETTQRLLDPSLPEGAVAACEEQTAGRGRLGSRWDAPAGRAILCSVLLRPPPDRAVPQLSLVGGIAAAELVERATGLPAQIKWPNDVLLGGRKVAGVLAEAAGGAVVLGIGLNVNQARGELPPDARRPVTSLLLEAGPGARERAPLLAELVGLVERRYAAWVVEGLEPLQPELAARDFLLGRKVVAGGRDGIARGIDGEGRLVVERDGASSAVESGEVDYER